MMFEATSRLSANKTETRIEQLENAVQDNQRQTQEIKLFLQQIWQKIEQLASSNPPPDRSTTSTPDPLIPNVATSIHPALKPATPSEFDGSRTMGKAFLMSCKLYFSLCANQFPNDQMKIQWVLSFMKTGRAATFAQGVYNRQLRAEDPVFENWPTFEKEFRSRFCPRDEETAAMNKLEGTTYYQGRRPVDDYIDQFEELVAAAGYMEGQVIVMKFRKGLDGQLQDRIAEMGVDRPADYDPAAWYEAARRFDANRAANRAFNATGRHAPPPTTTNTRSTLPFPRAALVPASSAFQRPPQPLPPAPPPRPQASGPVPMDVDTLRRKRALPGTCYRCGSTEHLVRDCPRTLDVRAIPVEEQDAMLEQLLAAADIRAAEGGHTVEGEEGQEGQRQLDEEVDQEDFGPRRG